MDTEQPEPSDNNPFAGLWSGPNGLRRVLAVFLPALLCALALQWATERYTVAPMCADHGEKHGLAYQGADATHANDVYTSVCRYRKPDGSEETISTSKVFPFLTDLWVSFALDLKMTVLAFLALSILADVGLKKLRPSGKKKRRKP
ncbi:MAG: hypothetical protein J0M09_15015 [Xanthomonadales bacterium]|nr:hypothetical protein [Xanthomonadales bacterium]